MMKVTITMVKDKETKNTFRYAEYKTTVLGTESRPGTIYIQKSAGINADAIEVVISTTEVPDGAVVGQPKANTNANANPIDFNPGF